MSGKHYRSDEVRFVICILLDQQGTILADSILLKDLIK